MKQPQSHKPPCEEHIMRKSIQTFAAAAALSALMALSPVFAQGKGAFDARKFFDELSARSVSMPTGFDSDKFFAELSAKSVSSGKKFDARAFFDELQSRGVKMPVGFDPNKFFMDMAETAGAMPPMVEMKP
jgi:hypothetical protein